MWQVVFVRMSNTLPICSLNYLLREVALELVASQGDFLGKTSLPASTKLFDQPDDLLFNFVVLVMRCPLQITVFQADDLGIS